MNRTPTGTWNLICYGYNPWSRMWKRNQTMVRLLAEQPFIDRAGFVNPPAYLARLLTGPGRELSGLRRETWRAALPCEREGIIVHTPVRPLFYSRSRAAALPAEAFTRRILERLSVRPYLLLLNRLQDFDDPVFAQLYDGAACRHFDWSDDFETFCTSDRQRAAAARVRDRFLIECDVVTTVNEHLAERARDRCPDAFAVRNATDFEVLNRADAPRTPITEALARLSGPVIGYIGYLNRERLDAELIESVAAARPDWQFVFLGPEATPRPLGDDLPRRDNVHLLPAVPYEELPGWLKGFDVCMLPNRLNEHTRGNDPIKLFDYLASGRPVVATPTAGTAELADVLHIAEGADAFLASLEAALAARDDAQAKAARLAAARANAWPSRFAPVFERLHGALQRRSAS